MITTFIYLLLPVENCKVSFYRTSVPYNIGIVRIFNNKLGFSSITVIFIIVSRL